MRIPRKKKKAQFGTRGNRTPAQEFNFQMHQVCAITSKFGIILAELSDVAKAMAEVTTHTIGTINPLDIQHHENFQEETKSAQRYRTKVF